MEPDPFFTFDRLCRIHRAATYHAVPVATASPEECYQRGRAMLVTAEHLALPWLRHAALQGHTGAQYEYGAHEALSRKQYFADDQNVPGYNHTRVLCGARWLYQAYRHSDPDAAIVLAFLVLSGQLGTINLALAGYLLEQAIILLEFSRDIPHHLREIQTVLTHFDMCATTLNIAAAPESLAETPQLPTDLPARDPPIGNCGMCLQPIFTSTCSATCQCAYLFCSEACFAQHTCQGCHVDKTCQYLPGLFSSQPYSFFSRLFKILQAQLHLDGTDQIKPTILFAEHIERHLVSRVEQRNQQYNLDTCAHARQLQKKIRQTEYEVYKPAA